MIETIAHVSIIFIAVSIISFMIVLMVVLKEVRRMRGRTEKLVDTIEGELKPILTDIKRVTEHAERISGTVRYQVEKVDSATDSISTRVNSSVEKWIDTFDMLHDALAEPAYDIAAFLKGVSKGMRFFFNNGREYKSFRE